MTRCRVPPREPSTFGELLEGLFNLLTLGLFADEPDDDAPGVQRVCGPVSCEDSNRNQDDGRGRGR